MYSTWLSTLVCKAASGENPCSDCKKNGCEQSEYIACAKCVLPACRSVFERPPPSKICALTVRTASCGYSACACFKLEILCSD